MALAWMTESFRITIRSIVHESWIDWSSTLLYRLPWWLSGKGSAYNAKDPGSIPRSGRSPGEEMATHSSILAWEILWIVESGRLQSMEVTIELDTT